MPSIYSLGGRAGRAGPDYGEVVLLVKLFPATDIRVVYVTVDIQYAHTASNRFAELFCVRVIDFEKGEWSIIHIYEKPKLVAFFQK